MAGNNFPQCWGHRGASSDYPENTLASFESAARAVSRPGLVKLSSALSGVLEGADGIESDVHVTSDDYILMSHDPGLDRTTIGGSGSIISQPYIGNIEHLWTAKQPKQKLPTFNETIDWFNKPENQHLQFNIDVKITNDPKRLFTLMRTALSTHENWETTIAPRLILGICHPKFAAHAIEILPNVKLCFVGIHLTLAQCPLFWEACDSYSIPFPVFTTAEGDRFRRRCKSEGKRIIAWMCNRQEEWAMAAAWGLDVVMTNKTAPYVAERKAAAASNLPILPRDPWFMWKSWRYYAALHWIIRYVIWRKLERLGGPIAPYVTP